MVLSLKSDAVVSKIKKAVRAGELKKAPVRDLIGPARNAGIISSDEAELVEHAEQVRWETIQVDSFSLQEYMENAIVPHTEPTGGDGAGRESETTFV